MKYTVKSTIFVLALLIFSNFTKGSTNIPAGNVSGTWTPSGSPYYIQGDVTVPSGNTLTIQAGVTVFFSGYYKMNVNGRLLALGTNNQKVAFTADPATYWHGIRILNSNANGMDSTKLVYCDFSNGKAMGSGTDVYGGAIYAIASHDVLIRACIFHHNLADRGGAVYLSNSSARIEKCLFYSNIANLYGGAIYNFGTTPSFDRITCYANSAVTSGGAIYQSTTGSVNVKNSIFRADTPTEIFIASGGSANITYSNIQGGFTGTGNINSDPLFFNAGNSRFDLTPCSPCIDSGDASSNDPDGTPADMGAWYFHHSLGSIIDYGWTYGTFFKDFSPYYICGDLTIPSDKSLFIEPGVSIVFTQGSGLDVEGRIEALGSITDSIYFTAFDTTGFSTGSYPGWGGIQIYNSDNNANDSSLFEYCVVRYTNGPSCIALSSSSDTRIEHSSISYNNNTWLTIFNDDSHIILRNCTISDNEQTGLMNEESNSLISNCRFIRNKKGIWATSSPGMVVIGCTFSENVFYPVETELSTIEGYSNNSYTDNGRNVFACFGSNMVLDTYLNDIGIPYYFTNSFTIAGLDGDDGVTTLEIAPGAELSFNNEGIIVGGYNQSDLPGALHAVGTEADPVIFSRYQYDDYASFGGIQFLNSSIDNNCRLEYCRVYYGGSYNLDNIICNSASPTIINTYSGRSFRNGIRCFDNANPSISRCILWDNELAGISISYASPIITNSVFENNGTGMTIESFSNSFPVVKNNIFRANSSGIVGSYAFEAEIDHNLFFQCIQLFQGDLPPGLGDFTITNFNGDACDPYYNLSKNPQWVNGTYYLTEGSPCINAGNPDDPFDPDNTIADIGLNYFHLNGSPEINLVKDVPNDQGKQVFLRWLNSPLDESGSSCTITSYSIWRQDEMKSPGENTVILQSIDQILELVESGKNEPGKTYSYLQDGSYWTYINSVPAIMQDEYVVVAPTIFDSVAASLNESTFRIIAHTNYSPMYFTSWSVSGYSVDNLAPATPLNLSANLNINQVNLEWDEVPDQDLQYYAIYRSDNPGGFPAEPYATSAIPGVVDPDPLSGTSYYLVTAFDVNGNESGQSNIAEVNFTSGITLNLRVFLQGPFTGNIMTTMLNNQGYLPVLQPYSTNPWNYNGTEAVGSIPNNNIVDWLLLELRETTGGPSTATSGKMIARKAVFVKLDGTITDMDGSSLPVINVAPASNLYVVLWHRNHLGIMTSGPVLPSGNIYTWDFTTGSSQVYGGTVGYKQLVPGKWGMIAGDGNRDFQVTSTDKISVWKPQVGQAGYKAGDYNLGGTVDNIDKLNYWQPNSGKACQIPE